MERKNRHFEFGFKYFNYLSAIGHKFHILEYIWTKECFAKLPLGMQQLKVNSYFEHGYNFIKATVFSVF